MAPTADDGDDWNDPASVDLDSPAGDAETDTPQRAADTRPPENEPDPVGVLAALLLIGNAIHLIVSGATWPGVAATAIVAVYIIAWTAARD